MAQKFQKNRSKRKNYKSRKTTVASDEPLNLSGCFIFLGAILGIIGLFFFSAGFRNWVIDIIAVLINTLVLSNLFLFNIVVILILLGLIFLVLFLYSRI